MNKRYNSNYSAVLTILAMHAVILAVSYSERGELQIGLDLPVLALLFGMPLFGFLLDLRTWLKITGSALMSSGHSELKGAESIPLHQVKEVRRIRQNILVGYFGSLMAFYGDDGHLMTVREANYRTKTLKQFLSDLKTKLPFVELDPQYEQLIEKDLEDLWDFKRIPATHSQF
ncbi:hypothetical protein [uncultured Roseobacter sp.]|uniref:hypothetical protein n=1 Tax=uncultured Roseobacter sp. TaxID=114847 RepID=UPI0026085C01|nr:hypothetical protein [uncultured Roseobacter sp.]